jgi:hypothetical protein
MTHLLNSNVFEHYRFSSEKDFEPRRSHFSKVSTYGDGMRARRIFYETDFFSGAFAGITTHKVRCIKAPACLTQAT